MFHVFQLEIGDIVPQFGTVTAIQGNVVEFDNGDVISFSATFMMEVWE